MVGPGRGVLANPWKNPNKEPSLWLDPGILKEKTPPRTTVLGHVFWSIDLIFKTRCWFQICFIFTPKIREDESNLTNIVQMGWNCKPPNQNTEHPQKNQCGTEVTIQVEELVLKMLDAPIAVASWHWEEWGSSQDGSTDVSD